MKNDTEKVFSDRVMGEIAKRKVVIRPKWYFTLLATVFAATLAFIWSVTIIFLSLGLFHIRQVNPHNYIQFGATGWFVFLKILPWELIIFIILGLLLAWLMVRRYDLSYKIGFGLMSAALIGGVVFVGFLLDWCRFGEQVEKAKIISLLIEHESVGDNWVEGKACEINNYGLKIKTHNDNEVTVILNDQSRSKEKDFFKLGETIRAVGRWNKNVFEAAIIEVDGD